MWNFNAFSAALICVLLAAEAANADICVWRDPEKTMVKVFPAARNYKTRIERIPEANLRALEKKHGLAWDEGEMTYIPKSGFHFYEILDAKNATLGIIVALAGKGDYGAIEIVMGLDAKGKVLHVYIQRIRERRAKDLRDAAFLNQFLGKGMGDMAALKKSFKPITGAEAPSEAVRSPVEKMLVLHEYFSTKEKR